MIWPSFFIGFIVGGVVMLIVVGICDIVISDGEL